jgi:non-ribosomal peptide synthetase component F
MEHTMLSKPLDGGDQGTHEMWFQNHTVLGSTEQCVHDLFSDLASTQPEAPAICAWDGEMTYGDLHEQSSRLASHLVGLGVGRGDIVPLCFEKSMWTITAMLAVLKAGGAFAPLDPEHPRRRHEDILKSYSLQHIATHCGQTLHTPQLQSPSHS